MIYKLIISFIIFILFTACGSTKKVVKSDSGSVIPDYQSKEYIGLRKKLAIAKFENATRFGKRRLGENMTAVLSTELAKTDRFILLERADVDQILEQVALSQSGITEGTLEQIQLLDADYILSGAVTHYSVTTTGSSNLFTQSKIQKAEVTTDVRIINIRTGEIVLSKSGSGIAEKEFSKVLGMGESGGYDESLELDAFRAAVINVTANIVKVLDDSPWMCDVVKISGDKLYLDAGKKSNIKLGDSLLVIKRDEAITNLSGAIIGFEETEIGSGSIIDFLGSDGSILKLRTSPQLELPLICRMK